MPEPSTTYLVLSDTNRPVDGFEYHVALAYWHEGDEIARFDDGINWDAADANWVGDPPWNDISDNLKQVSITRGHDTPVDRFRPGSCNFTMYDPTGVLSPWRTASVDRTGWTEIRPGIEVRVWVVDPDLTEHDRFTGLVDGISDAFPDPTVENSHDVTFTCYDFLALPSAYEVGPQAAQGLGETAGPRIDRILRNAQYRGDRRLDDGTITLQATTLEKNALDECGLVADTEFGAFLCDRSGVLVFRDRAGLNGDPLFSDVQVVFGEIEPEVCYKDLKLADDLSKVRNVITVSNVGGTAAMVSDGLSVSIYRPRAYKRDDLIHEHDSDSTVIAQQYLDTFAYAERRIEGFAVDLTVLDDAQRIALLELDLLHRIEIRRRAYGFQTVAELQVQAMTEEATHDSWAITLSTFDAALVFDVGRWDVDIWDTGLWGY